MLCFLLLTDHLRGIYWEHPLLVWTQPSTWPSFDPTNLMLHATYYVDHYPPISVTMLYNVEIQTLPGCNSTIGIWWYVALVGRSSMYNFFSYVSRILKLQDITSISVMTYSTISIFHRCFAHLLQPRVQPYQIQVLAHQWAPNSKLGVLRVASLTLKWF